MKRRKNNNFMVMLPYLIVLVVILAALFFMNFKKNEIHEIKTGELIQEIKNEKVTELTVTPKSGESVYIVTGKLKDIYIDSKLTKEERENQPIVVDSSGEIIWIPGLKKSKFDKAITENYDIILWYNWFNAKFYRGRRIWKEEKTIIILW